MPADDRERLDHYLVRTGLAHSRRAAREMVEGGRVRVNGRVCGKGAAIDAADRIEVEQISEAPALPPDTNVKLDILFRDSALLVVNKPAPMPCHPLRPGEMGTVMNGVVAVFPTAASCGDTPREGGLIHRLDNGTSGALLVALEKNAFTGLRAAIREGRVIRRYQALAIGKCKEILEINSPIAHDPRSQRKMVAVGGQPHDLSARPAVTMVEPVRRIGRFTLLTVTPRTGMRHQIRVHLASAGHPLAGDALYGGPSFSALEPGRFWLHLAELEFRSPASGPVRVRSPWPSDLREAIAQASRGSGGG